MKRIFSSYATSFPVGIFLSVFENEAVALPRTKMFLMFKYLLGWKSSKVLEGLFRSVDQNRMIKSGKGRSFVNSLFGESEMHDWRALDLFTRDLR